MEEQEQFLEILNEIKEIAISQDNQMTKEEIKQYLNYMELSDEKLNAVCRYLAAAGIKIHGTKENIYQETTSLTDSSKINGIIKDFLMGEASARDTLAKSKLSHVIELAAAYKQREAVVNQIITMDDIIAEGNVGLLVGISVIEKDKSQYLKNNGEPDYETVNGIINMEIVNAMESMIDTVSENSDWESAFLAKANLLHQATQHLAQEYGRIPSKVELSAYTKVSTKEINDIMSISKDTKKVISSEN